MHQYLLREIAVREHLSESDIELCIKCSEPFSVSKNTILEETGKIPRYLYYIVSGFMRLFYYDENGDEATMHINCPYGFFTAFSHFSNQTISPVNVECITDCEVLRISKSNYDILMKESVAWKDYSLFVLQESMTYNENRSKDFATLTADQRYRKLMETHPEIIQNVPLQYIASFLGMKPESLSRIRRNLIT